MSTERDLLPWILGGALLIPFVVAMGFSVATRPAAVMAPPPPALTASPASAATNLPSTPAAPMPAAPVPLIAAIASGGVPAPQNRIYECDLNGHMTFADSPCGEHATVREISAVNTMAAVRPSAPYSSSAAAYPSMSISYADQADAAPDVPQSQAGPVYLLYGGASREHPARHHPHLRGSQAMHH